MIQDMIAAGDVPAYTTFTKEKKSRRVRRFDPRCFVV